MIVDAFSLATRVFGRWVAGGALFLCVVPAFAGMVYEGSRIDYASGKADLNLKISVGERDLRIDILSDGAARVSFIRRRNVLIVFDHASGRYSQRNISDTGMTATAMKAEDVSMRGELRSTARKQFALGSYCRVNELWQAAQLVQELCLVEFNRLPATDSSAREQAEDFALIGAILLNMTLVTDPAMLLNMTIAGSQFESQLDADSVVPLIVRRFEQGTAVREVRLSRLSRMPLSRDTFNLPYGAKPMPAKSCDAHDAGCAAMISSLQDQR